MAATIAKTVVATGASSGLGFEAVRQLLSQAQPYRFILGARDTARTQAAYDELGFDKTRHSLTILPLELSDLKGVRTFAQQTLEKLAGPDDRLDYLFLNAAMAKGTEESWGPGKKWCESYYVNHLSQHYLLHLLRDKLVASKSRIVVVSSGAVRVVQDTGSVLDESLKDASGTSDFQIYSYTKFVQLLGAHWWRRQLAGTGCTILAVSPGLVPYTGLTRGLKVKPQVDMKDAKSITEGAASLLRAFTVDDFPADPDQIFFTSWGEWWAREEIEKSLDKSLQDKWSPSKEEIEREEGLE